jgi:predicted ester cyclase
MPTPNGSEDQVQSPIAVTERFRKEVLNDRNLSVIDEIAAEDHVELDPLPGQAPGREGLKAFLEIEFFPAFPDQQWVAEEHVTEGEKVVTRFTFHGTHQGTFMGIPPTGRRVAVGGVVIDRVVDGKWKDSRFLLDNLALLEQLGVLPQTPSAATA